MMRILKGEKIKIKKIKKLLVSSDTRKWEKAIAILDSIPHFEMDNQLLGSVQLSECGRVEIWRNCVKNGLYFQKVHEWEMR
jgi:hypothetical protein